MCWLPEAARTYLIHSWFHCLSVFFDFSPIRHLDNLTTSVLIHPSTLNSTKNWSYLYCKHGKTSIAETVLHPNPMAWAAFEPAVDCIIVLWIHLLPFRVCTPGMYRFPSALSGSPASIQAYNIYFLCCLKGMCMMSRSLLFDGYSIGTQELRSIDNTSFYSA